jgi:hypothetical protein
VRKIEGIYDISQVITLELNVEETTGGHLKVFKYVLAMCPGKAINNARI